MTILKDGKGRGYRAGVNAQNRLDTNSVTTVTEDNEIRTGLVAQEVQAVLDAHNLPDTPVLDTKWATVDDQLQELMSMRYERLVPMLRGAVKELTTRVAQLESQLQ